VSPVTETALERIVERLDELRAHLIDLHIEIRTLRRDIRNHTLAETSSPPPP
jgi:hypothetical protein